jgi:hypothetical protein
MSEATINAAIQLAAGGLVLPKTKVDAGATEQIVARSYRHPALGERPVIRLASDRLGQAEDVAMEYLGFEAPKVSAPLAVQQRRSLGFAAWALINDPDNARFALELVKRMKKSARQAKSKPGHAWDAYFDMAKDLGRSARNLLPAFWEEVGRTFKDLENQTYAGRALNKSLEAERVHALESDRARRRDVVLEFVLAGCLSGSALSDYGNDLVNQYAPQEAFTIFRDLCTRRTTGGMAPWATLPRDFMKLAKAAKLDENQEFEAWLEEVIDAPAMGRAPNQFWKACGAACKKIVGRNPAFAVALLKHTRPEPRYYGESKLGPWFELLEEWGVFDYLWEDEHNGAPLLGEPVALWFGRIIADDVPAPLRTLDMLSKLTPRLKKENTPLPLAAQRRYGGSPIDIDVLEACLALGIRVADPPAQFTINFNGWLSPADHALRNQDIIESARDERFRAAVQEGLGTAIACRGGACSRGYRQADIEQRPFPIAAGDRPGIRELWRQHAADTVGRLENTGLPDFEAARAQLQTTLWPDTLRLFPEVAERLARVDPAAVLQTTLRAGVFDEYGLPAFENAVAEHNLSVRLQRYEGADLHLCFPDIIISDKVHAYVIHPHGAVDKRELRLPAKSEVTQIFAVGNDLAVTYRDPTYKNYLVWLNNPEQIFEAGYIYFGQGVVSTPTVLADGSVFNGQHAIRPGDKQIPAAQDYFHDRERFWRLTWEHTGSAALWVWKLQEVEPQSGKTVRTSVPAWFEDPDGGAIDPGTAELLPMPRGADDSPLGVKDGMIGWKTILRNNAFAYGEGIDGRRWDKPLGASLPVGLLRRPGASDYLPVTATNGRLGTVRLWDPTGSTTVATLEPFGRDYAHGHIAIPPLRYWHLLKVRDEASSKILRGVSREQCAELFKAAAVDRGNQIVRRGPEGEPPPGPIDATLPAVKKLLPTAPERLAIGVARIVRRAEQEGCALNSLRDKAVAESADETKASSAVVHGASDFAAAQWGLRHFHIYGEKGEVSVSANIAAAAEFLKGNAKAGPLPRTDYMWFPMVENAGLACWQTFWRAAAARMARKDGASVPWLEFLRFWHEHGIAELPGQFDILDGHPEGAKRNSWGAFDIRLQPGSSLAIDQGGDKFILIESDSNYQSSVPHSFLRYSTAAKPAKPAGYTITSVRKARAKLDPADRAAFIAAVESAGIALPAPTADELAEVAAAVAASPTEIALVWTGGLNLDSYQNNFLPADVRAAFGMKTTDASAARQSLRNLSPEVRARLYEAVTANGAAAPFAADRGPVLRSIEAAWQANMPKRLSLDAALQKKLSAIGKAHRWQTLNHEHLLALASDPVNHPLLQPQEMEIAVDSNRNYATLQLRAKSKTDQVLTADLLRNIVQLVGLVHAETPAGDPARKEMPALIKQTTKLVNSPATMFDLRTVHLHEYGRRKPPTATEWLNKYVGATKTNAKDGCSRVDVGLIVGAGLDKSHQAATAFRPAKLKDDADVARLDGILALDMGEGYRLPPSTILVVAAVKSPGFQKLVKAILVPGVAKGKWPHNPLLTAPDVVKDIRKKHKLGDEAAALYAQLLALPDPTSANIGTWNEWGPAQLKKAAAELVGRKLVLEAARARAGRSIFLPGEWLDLKAPWLPIETWKLAHLVEYGINPKVTCPVDGPMVLRPFEELFAAAWKRVVDGDPPRYEEAKRKKKTKK